MDLIDPNDSLEKQNAKLLRITQSLMRRVEQAPDQTGLAYAQFERAALLEKQVKQRTTDLERALDLLHQSNARIELANSQAKVARQNLARAIETIDEGFAMFDQDDRLVMFNSRFCKGLTDVRPFLKEGTEFAEYIRMVSESVFLDDGDDPGGRTAWRQKRMRLHAKEHAVFNIRLVDNSWLQVSEHRTDTNGTVVLQTDVTQIMRLERRERSKLIEQQAIMLRGTLDHLNQGVCIFDAQRCLVGWNKQMREMVGFSLDENLQGAAFADLLKQIANELRFGDSFRQDDLNNWAQIPAGRPPVRFEVRRDDDTVLDVFAQEMPDTGFVISFTDITQERLTSNALRELNETLERRVAERTTALGEALEDARRANASKDRFVAAASHDLLQPLSAARLYAASLEDRCTDARDKEIARKAVSALTTAENLIDTLMDISKLDLGLADYNLIPIALDTVLSALAFEYAPLAEQKGITLRFMPTTCVVVSDPVYLRRILQNFVANALRYTTGNKVVIGARRRGGAIRIDVIDQGPGLSIADQELIFQEFKQAAAGKANGEGLGLGLAIVERACKMLGHDLELVSREGSGSRFSISLEASSQSAADTLICTGQQTPMALQSHVVGLVENDEALAQSITLALELFGSDVIHMRSGEEALELMDELGIVPDGWLLDYQLGDGMDGVTLAGALRRKFGDTPIQIISADRSHQLRHRCISLDLPLRRKPITREDLHDFLSQLQPNAQTHSARAEE